MNNSTFIFSKLPLQDTEVEFDITMLLVFGETLVSIVPQTLQPVTTPALTFTLTSLLVPQIAGILKGGLNSTSYGIPIIITTSTRSFQVLLAVSVQTSDQVPYTTANLNAYNDLIDVIQAGNSAIGTAVFTFPPNVDPSGGYVTWQLFDASGTVYSQGNAYSYEISSLGLTNTVFAKAIVNVPSTVPPSLNNQKYQLCYTLTLPSSQTVTTSTATTSITTNITSNSTSAAQQQLVYLSYENITVTGGTTVPLGTQASVELVGDQVTLSIVIDQLYDTVALELYQGNTLLGSQVIPAFQRVASGYYYSGYINTAQMQASLVPYTAVWKYSNRTNTNQIFRESAPLWLITPTIMQCIDDVKSKINKARTTLYGATDLLFPSTTILTWLRRGMDTFNNAYGQMTNFNMTNALGGIREYWLLCTEVAALESQYLAEGEKAFQFSGAAITLDVDRTQYLDSAASKIQSRLDSELPNIKKNLIIKGNIAGDGSADTTRLQQGAIAAIGITITPASPQGYLYPSYQLGYGLM